MQAQPPASTALKTDSRPTVLCRYFAQGGCKKGDKCPYAHVVGEDNGNAGLQSDDEPIKKEALWPDDWIRNLDGALVRFGDGTRVLKLNLPSDFSAVRLNKLPVGTTKQFVADALARIGFVVNLDVIRVLSDESAGPCVADVRVEDPTFARRLCSTLTGKEYGRITPKIEAIPINNPLPKGSGNSARVDCKKVHLSWHRPVRLAWLNFGSQDIARKIHDKFGNGTYKVLGQVVGCNAPKGGGGRGGRRGNPLAWTVVLTNVPGSATRDNIVMDIPTSIRPRHVEIGSPTYSETIGNMNAIAKSFLSHIGPLEVWEDASELGGKRAKAKARFLDDEDAQKAATTLNNKVMTFNKMVKLTIQLVYSARMKESERIYQAVKEEIEKERKAWREEHVLFVPYPPNKGYRVLKLEGEDRVKVGQAKKTMDGILEGQVVLDDQGKALWAPSFADQGNMLKKIKGVGEVLGIAIVRDRRRCQLRLYGPEAKRSNAVKLLRRYTGEASCTTYVAELDQTQFAWACRGGFRAISAALPDAAVTFDIISTPRRIQVTGSEEHYRLAIKMIQTQIERPAVEKAPADDETIPDCAICWTEADNPIHTKCGHDYCGDCFERLCASGSNKPASSVACEGDMGRCKTVLPLSELQDHLSSSAFEDLLYSSFTSYVRAHQEVFRYCPSPGCEQIYRCTPSPVSSTPSSSLSGSTAKDHVFVCPSCLVATCTSCHASHTGLTCAEHKDIKSGGLEALRKTKEKLGVKDCPKCATPLEKTEGCDHMTCGGCGTHICWRCLKTFKTSEECYGHLNKVHGGIGLEHGGRRLF